MDDPLGVDPLGAIEAPGKREEPRQIGAGALLLRLSLARGKGVDGDRPKLVSPSRGRLDEEKSSVLGGGWGGGGGGAGTAW